MTFLAGIGYAWNFNQASLEPFYAAAARSMSGSWHDAFFGAFDPAGTITVDKLPGALWLQAVSLRVFGFHVWAVVLPQVLEGMLTILVLCRAVRRLAGPVAGITAAVIVAASPVTMTLDRGNVSDSLLILLTVLAADATSAALLTGRLQSLLTAGLWIGLAFQAKMLQAWLVLPALAIAYFVAAPGRARRRLAHIALAGTLAVAVSISWMSVVALISKGQRPFVDGTRDDSPFTQVFNYNGTARLKLTHLPVQPASFIEKLVRLGQTVNNNTSAIAPSWHRLLEGVFARDGAWLLPAALIAAIVALVQSRKEGRRSPMRACVLLWGCWLLVLGAFFSAGTYLNSYYIAALVPAVAALCGVGATMAFRGWDSPRVRAQVTLAVLAMVGYGCFLLSGAQRAPGWVVPAVICLSLAGTVIVIRKEIYVRAGRRLSSLTVAVACALVLPAVASAVVVSRSLGPFDEPYAPPRLTLSTQRQDQAGRDYIRALGRDSIASVPLATYTRSWPPH